MLEAYSPEEQESKEIKFNPEEIKEQEKIVQKQFVDDVVDESFELSVPLDFRTMDALKKYILEGKLKSNENPDLERIVEWRVSHFTAWKLKYFYDNPRKSIAEITLAITNDKRFVPKYDPLQSIAAVEPLAPWQIRQNTPTAPAAPKPISTNRTQAPKKIPRPTPKTTPKPATEQTFVEMARSKAWQAWNAIRGAIDDAWEYAWDLFNQITNWISKDLIDLTGISPEEIPIVWSIVKEAINWMKVPYAYGWTWRGGIDCSAFMSRLLAAVAWKKYDSKTDRYTTTTLKNISKRIPNYNDAKPWDLVYSHNWWHVEMIIKIWKEKDGWHAYTLWSAKTNPMDQNGQKLKWSWPWYRKRRVTWPIYRPKIYDAITHTA